MNEKDKAGHDIKYPASDKLNKEIGEVQYTQEAKQSLIDAFKKVSDEFAEESLRKKVERENEKIKFIGGAEFSLNEIKNLVTPYPQGYDSLFPNEIPFYTHMYRLNKWDDLKINLLSNTGWFSIISHLPCVCLLSVFMVLI